MCAVKILKRSIVIFSPRCSGMMSLFHYGFKTIQTPIVCLMPNSQKLLHVYQTKKTLLRALLSLKLWCGFSWKNDNGHAQFFCSAHKRPNRQEKCYFNFCYFVVWLFFWQCRSFTRGKPMPASQGGLNSQMHLQFCRI